MARERLGLRCCRQGCPGLSSPAEHGEPWGGLGASTAAFGPAGQCLELMGPALPACMGSRGISPFLCEPRPCCRRCRRGAVPVLQCPSSTRGQGGRQAAPKGSASLRSAQPPAPCCESQLCSLAVLVAADMAPCDAPCKGAIGTILSNGFSPPCNSANELFPGSGLNLSAPGSGEVLPAVTCKAKPPERATLKAAGAQPASSARAAAVEAREAGCAHAPAWRSLSLGTGGPWHRCRELAVPTRTCQHQQAHRQFLGSY